MAYNFRLFLIEACIRVNDWEMAETILGGVYEYRLDLTLNESLLKAFFDALHYFLEPLYAPLSKRKFIIGSKNSSQVPYPFLY